MGTRAIYQFNDSDVTAWGDKCFVYKHYDNYPQGAVDFIENAKGYAWGLPRFEADEFAAAFVAANKNPKGGEIRLVSHHFENVDEILDAHNWCDYYYVIHFDKNVKDLWVEIKKSIYHKDGSTDWRTIWQGAHADMINRYGRDVA